MLQQVDAADDGTGRQMLGLDTGNPEADAEAEMWIAALLGTLAAAIPVAVLNPSLGFRRRRSAHHDSFVSNNIIDFLSRFRYNT